MHDILSLAADVNVVGVGRDVRSRAFSAGALEQRGKSWESCPVGTQQGAQAPEMGALFVAHESVVTSYLCTVANGRVAVGVAGGVAPPATYTMLPARAAEPYSSQIGRSLPARAHKPCSTQAEATKGGAARAHMTSIYPLLCRTCSRS